MKRLFIFILSFVMTFTLLNCQPRLEVIGGDTFDWKKVTPKESPLKTKILLYNAGTEKLLISNVHPTCGCTTAPLNKNELMPGDTAILDVSVNVGATTGQLTKTINITSNDPKNTSKTLFLKADVIRPLQVMPRPYFIFDNMKVGYESSANLNLRNNSDGIITITSVSVEPANVIVNLKNNTVLKPGQEIELIAKVKPEQAGTLNFTLRMKTSHPDYADFPINGYGKVEEAPIFNK
jgi:hypothetical protein